MNITEITLANFTTPKCCGEARRMLDVASRRKIWAMDILVICKYADTKNLETAVPMRRTIRRRCWLILQGAVQSTSTVEEVFWYHVTVRSVSRVLKKA
mmetsp:Transcript_17941/g.28161  ORF Transcript_17941/g.28161 Transcript_17941/m.28161 type:complete len:98 (+) Transcript_17941:1297-1590(+)